MDRKRDNRDSDWFSGSDWNIEDIFGNLDSEFRKMRKQMDNLMRDAVEGNLPDHATKNPFVFGFSVSTGPDGVPKFEDFGNTRIRPFSSSKTGSKEATVDTSREPLTDVNETDTEIAITVELPGVAKEDIDINVAETKVEVKVETESRNYFKKIELSNEVQSKSSKATYTNGILDLVLKKKISEKVKGTKVKVN
jgi:HSP20 family protein